MFAQKIDQLQDQILRLQQQQQQYVSLDAETNNALALIVKVREQAARLGEVETVSQMFLEVLQPEPTPAPQEESLPQPEPETAVKTYQEAAGTTPTETVASLVEEAEEETTESNLERYLNPEELQQALNGDDSELVLMEVASLLDTSHQDDVEERVRYFLEKLPLEMSDRLISYLPKTLALLWVQVREKVEEEARASIFPESPIAIGTRVEIKNDSEQGIVSWIGQNNNGEAVASVTVTGATRGGIPVNELEPKTDASPNEPPTSEDPEVDELARLCLKQKAWSQMRLFADRNPNVIIRMQQIASTKTELRLVNNLPSLILGYIGRANDRTDLGWLPEPVLSEVEFLLSQPQEQSIA